MDYWRLGLKAKYSIVYYHAKVKKSYKCKGENLLSIEKSLVWNWSSFAFGMDFWRSELKAKYGHVSSMVMCECTWSSPQQAQNFLKRGLKPKAWEGFHNRNENSWHHKLKPSTVLCNTMSECTWATPQRAQKLEKIGAQANGFGQIPQKESTILKSTNWMQVWYYVVPCLSALGLAHRKHKNTI